MVKTPNIFKRVRRKTKAEKIKDQLKLLELCKKDVPTNKKYDEELKKAINQSIDFSTLINNPWGG